MKAWEYVHKDYIISLFLESAISDKYCIEKKMLETLIVNVDVFRRLVAVSKSVRDDTLHYIMFIFIKDLCKIIYLTRKGLNFLTEAMKIFLTL